MRVTARALWKRVRRLENALNYASQFNQLPLITISARAALDLKGTIGFIPVCRYGLGALVLRGEAGTDGNYRYLCSE